MESKNNDQFYLPGKTGTIEIIKRKAWFCFLDFRVKGMILLPTEHIFCREPISLFLKKKSGGGGLEGTYFGTPPSTMLLLHIVTDAKNKKHRHRHWG